MEDDADGLYGGPRSKLIPLTHGARLYKDNLRAKAQRMVAENTYKTTIAKPNITRSKTPAYDNATAIARIKLRTALQNELAKGQSLLDQAFADKDHLDQECEVNNMRENYDRLYKLDASGLRRKRNKSRNKMYSARKKSKRRRVKSTRRRHKKSTRHHHSKY